MSTITKRYNKKGRSKYNKIDIRTEEGIDRLYNTYKEQFNRTKNYIIKQNANEEVEFIRTPGLRMRTGERYSGNVSERQLFNREMLDKDSFERAIKDEYQAKDKHKHESMVQLAQRMAKEEVLDIDKGFYDSIKAAYDAEHGLFEDMTDEDGKPLKLTYKQIIRKMQFDYEFRQKYFDLINDKYAELKAEKVFNEETKKWELKYKDTKSISLRIGQLYFGSD